MHVNTLLSQLKAQTGLHVLGLEGDVVNYRNAENVWNWTLKNAKLTFALDEPSLAGSSNSMMVEDLQVVAADAFPGRVIRRGRKKKAVTTTTAAKKASVKKETVKKEAAEPKSKKVKAEPE